MTAGRLIVLALAVSSVVAHAEQPVDLVDPFIGTGGHGHTYPGPGLPFGMIQPGPDTRLEGWDGCSGYHHGDTVVYGFSHTHLSGTGVPDYGDILLLPATGSPRFVSGHHAGLERGYGSRFRKATERASPGYYAVRLDDYGVEAELTATARTGWHRWTFPASDTAHVLVDLQHRDEVLESTLRVVDDRTIEGMRRSSAWAVDQPVYFVAVFDRPFDALLAVDDEPRPGLREASGRNVKAALRWPTAMDERLEARVAISAVDVAGARANLTAEAANGSFDSVRQSARDVWNAALSRIEVEGGTAEQRTVFYTALYHALLQPNLFQDADGRFLGRDGRVHRAEDYTRYTVFSLWDTFRAAHPLYTILEPRRTVDFVRTFLAQYREVGRLPVWELWGNETDCMIGYHAVPVIVDAWVKGIRDFDPELALEAMNASALGDRFGLDAYREHGYIPADRASDSVSRTLEYAYDDWCIARFAGDVGREDDRRTFLRRAQGWQHLVDAQGFLHARAAGRWIEPFDPAEVTFHYTEANAWQYSFFVPHDITGLAERLGGFAALERRLDELFAADSRLAGREQPDITGLVGQYAHGNEPSHHMAYLHAFAGAPHKTQALVRRLVDEMYAARPDGLVGNEDCGQMSAWLVFSALGFYPVTPGTPDYVLGTPLFDRATLHLDGGRRFVIRAERSAPDAFYVQGATLDGKLHPRAWISHDAIVRGGELAFALGPQPSSWGGAPADRPATAIGGERVTPAPIVGGPVQFAGSAQATITAAAHDDAIHYTLDGSDPGERSPRYTQPLAVDAPVVLKARARRDGQWSPLVEAPFRAIDPALRLTLAQPFSPQYPAGGELALIDGARGGEDFRLGTWQGFHGVDLDATLDLGRVRDVERIATGFLQDSRSWIFLPVDVSYAISEDGAAWREVGREPNDLDPLDPAVLVRQFAVELHAGSRARFVRVVARSLRTCPARHPGAGHPAWLFADEIAVE